MLDLALAVDRRIGDDGDGLVDVVRQMRMTGGEDRERPIPAERSDRLVRGLRHELRHAQIVGLESERAELLLAPPRDVLELVRRRADLPAVIRLAPRSGLLRRDTRGLRTTRLGPLADVHARDIARLALRDEPRAQRGLIDELPSGLIAAQRHARAGAERIRIADVALERDEPALAREDVLVVGLDVPQRPQAERVDAEDARVADAREERRRPLRERAERGARLHVEVLHARRHAADLVHDRREEQLDRLDRREALAQHEAAEDRVDILRVGAVARQRDAQRDPLLAQPSDGVDLAVVRERGERLHAVECGARVRRVAIVTERHARREALVVKIVEVRNELLGSTAQLVDDAVAREADDRRARESLDLDARLVQRARSNAATPRREERELPEPRLLRSRARAERVAIRRAASLDEHRDAVARQQTTDRGLLVAIGVARHGAVGVAWYEQVRDRESVAARVPRVASLALQKLCPQRARGMSVSTPAPSPSPSTQPERWASARRPSMTSASTRASGRPSLRAMATSPQASRSSIRSFTATRVPDPRKNKSLPIWEASSASCSTDATSPHLRWK